MRPVASFRVTISDGNTFFKRDFVKLKKTASSLVRGRKVECSLQLRLAAGFGQFLRVNSNFPNWNGAGVFFVEPRGLWRAVMFS